LHCVRGDTNTLKQIFQTNKIYSIMTQQVEKITIEKAIELINSCGYSNHAGHHYDRFWKNTVMVNDVKADGFSDKDWAFGYDSQKQQTPSNNVALIASLKSGDKVTVKKYAWGKEPDQWLCQVPYGSEHIPQYEATLIIE